MHPHSIFDVYIVYTLYVWLWWTFFFVHSTKFYSYCFHFIRNYK